MIHKTTIIGLTLGAQSILVLAELTDLIVLGILLAGAASGYLGMAIGGTKGTALTVRCAGQMILNGYDSKQFNKML